MGLVYLVGAGPGDPGLITLKGKEAIKRADVIVYDRLASSQLLRYARSDAERIYVGKSPEHHTYTQEEINDILVQKAKEGKIVTRLKGGDPFVFGRGGEEAERLAAEGIPFEVIPGITSAIAVPAYAGIPVTHRDFNSSFAIVSGHKYSSVQWGLLAQATETLVFLMGVSNLPLIVEELIKHGRPEQTPIALIRWGTRVEQETLVGTLADIVEKAREAKFRSPAIIIVGNVVRLREKISWFEKKPLFGKRVLVTRSRSQNSELAEKIEALGGEAWEFPVIQITPPTDWEPLDRALDRLGEYDWVIFTSANGVKFFFQRLLEKKIDIRQMAKARIAAVGEKTAIALREKGLLVDVFPGEFKAEALVESLRPFIQPGQEILIPRANIARNVLPQELEQMGCHVTAVDAYETRPNIENATEIIEMLREGAIHIITFTSSSTVKNLVEGLKSSCNDVIALLNQATIACIGPITASTAEKLGLRVDVIAENYTIEGLLERITKQLQPTS
ncbi:uroporphyrinogen-III C-methyltransferase [Thermoflavimicrobium dichotomicum]